jgi:hypothetical protein
MCVSAEASFALSGLLVPVGVYCMRKAGQRDTASLPLAAVPVLFGIQQFFEGLVWFGLGHDKPSLTRSAALAYLFFALAFWLFWIPLSAMFLESRRKIKTLLGLISLLGLAGGLAYYLPILLGMEPLSVTAVQHSIQYQFGHLPALDVLPQAAWHLAYLAIVSLPFILVARKQKGLIVLSTALIFSAAISHAYFWHAYASVWCFSAALLSLLIGYMFYGLPSAAQRRLDNHVVVPLAKSGVRG